MMFKRGLLLSLGIGYALVLSGCKSTESAGAASQEKGLFDNFLPPNMSAQLAPLTLTVPIEFDETKLTFKEALVSLYCHGTNKHIIDIEPVSKSARTDGTNSSVTFVSQSSTSHEVRIALKSMLNVALRADIPATPPCNASILINLTAKGGGRWQASLSTSAVATNGGADTAAALSNVVGASGRITLDPAVLDAGNPSNSVCADKQDQTCAWRAGFSYEN